MAFQKLSDASTKQVQVEIGRCESRALANKRRADVAGGLLIALGVVSATMIALPDSVLELFKVAYLRQVVPVLAGGVYAAIRYYRWGDKHRWYWYKRHRLVGLLLRNDEKNSQLAREVDEILQMQESSYPQPIYVQTVSTNGEETVDASPNRLVAARPDPAAKTD